LLSFSKKAYGACAVPHLAIKNAKIRLNSFSVAVPRLTTQLALLERDTAPNTRHHRRDYPTPTASLSAPASRETALGTEIEIVFFKHESHHAEKDILASRHNFLSISKWSRYSGTRRVTSRFRAMVGPLRLMPLCGDHVIKAIFFNA
jgi:hypothetical protein